MVRPLRIPGLMFPVGLRFQPKNVIFALDRATVNNHYFPIVFFCLKVQVFVGRGRKTVFSSIAILSRLW